MIGPFVLLGTAIQAIAWRLVALRRAPFWPVVGGTWAVLGPAALAIGEPAWCDDRGPGFSLAVGVASGLVLCAATRVVVAFASRFGPLARAVGETYARSTEAGSVVVWFVTLGVAVPGEELFWRGVATPWLVDAAGRVAGGILAWLVAAGVALSWASLPFLAGAAVGGALWTTLAIATGGVLAPIASHVTWTACMIAWRPPSPRAKVAG